MMVMSARFEKALATVAVSISASKRCCAEEGSWSCLHADGEVTAAVGGGVNAWCADNDHGLFTIGCSVPSGAGSDQVPRRFRGLPYDTEDGLAVRIIVGCTRNARVPASVTLAVSPPVSAGANGDGAGSTDAGTVVVIGVATVQVVTVSPVLLPVVRLKSLTDSTLVNGGQLRRDAGRDYRRRGFQAQQTASPRCWPDC